MPVEVLQPHLDALARHVHAIVFGAFLIEAAGIPFPSRLILVVAATLAERRESLADLVLLSASGAVIGDHVPYLAGKWMGPRLLGFYCRLTLGSAQCVEKTVAYFARFGAAAVLLSRFSASVRIFASVLSGCGYIAYRRFVLWDVVGSLVYATVWVMVGHLIGDHAIELMRQYGGARLLLLIGPLALVGLIVYRLWRRRREGPVRSTALPLVACSPPGARFVEPISPEPKPMLVGRPTDRS
jgi:membrane protein DedA with SNARE-associated domain